MAYSVGSAAAGGGEIGTGFSCVALKGRPGPGQDQSKAILEEVTLSPESGGAVSSESAGTVTEADGAAVVAAGADEAAGRRVPPDCGVGGVQATRISRSASSPAPVVHALVGRRLFPV